MAETQGNWHPFPPPLPGYFRVRRVTVGEDGIPGFVDCGVKRAYMANGRLMVMGRRISKMRADAGWQFQFQQQTEKGVPINWRPMAVMYDLSDPDQPRVTSRQDITGQLPLAHHIEEARYIVRHIPDRWPVFRQIHVEYTEERLQS